MVWIAFMSVNVKRKVGVKGRQEGAAPIRKSPLKITPPKFKNRQKLVPHLGVARVFDFTKWLNCLLDFDCQLFMENFLPLFS
jgi:hypothetical protein